MAPTLSSHETSHADNLFACWRSLTQIQHQQEYFHTLLQAAWQLGRDDFHCCEALYGLKIKPMHVNAKL